jgi:hypothetical protein
MSVSDDDELLHRYGWSADEINRMSPSQRQAALDECRKQAREDSMKGESTEFEAPSVLRVAQNTGAAVLGLKPRQVNKWLAMILFLAVAAGVSVHFRGLNESPESKVRTDSACGRNGWKTSVTLDNTRPELVSSSLRSENDVGSRSAPACVDIIFACRPDGPYFEVRVDSMNRRITGMGPIVVSRIGDDLSLKVSGPPSDDGKAIRVSQKAAVEVLASELMDGYGFAIAIRFADGDVAVAQFASFELYSALRPVLLACKMRFLGSVMETGSLDEPEQYK